MNTRLSVSAHKQLQPLTSFQETLKMKPYFRRKDKVVFVVGPTGTGKSRLAIDLATRFTAEVVNCDKMQVYKGLDITTNKVTEEECRGVPHHLLGIVDDPNASFTSDDFRRGASLVVESLQRHGRLPIFAGGSNSFIEALTNEDPEFRLRNECCFLWVDVSLPVLYSFVSERVDRMVKAGLVEEVRAMFDPENTDYSQGIRRAIGFPELDDYFRREAAIKDAKTRDKLLGDAIGKIKENTCTLACRQLQKIQRLRKLWNWNMHRFDATEVFLRRSCSERDEAEEAWENLVVGPSTVIVDQFLYNYHDHHHVTSIVPPDVGVISAASTVAPLHVPAMAAATR